MIAAGAQHIDSGIHRGLVIRQRKKNTMQRAISINTTLDYRIISSKKINENRENFKANFAICLALENIKIIEVGFYFFLEKE